MGQPPHAQLSCSSGCADSAAANMSAAYGHVVDGHAHNMRTPPEAMVTDGGVLSGESEADAFHRAAVLLSANLGGGRGE